jgi:hypothetical protein
MGFSAVDIRPINILYPSQSYILLSYVPDDQQQGGKDTRQRSRPRRRPIIRFDGRSIRRGGILGLQVSFIKAHHISILLQFHYPGYTVPP